VEPEPEGVVPPWFRVPQLARAAPEES